MNAWVSGKSSAAINYINSAPYDQKFLYITPLKTEQQRIVESCPNKHFKIPIPIKNTKLNGLKELINKGYNIVSTHALFHKFDREIIDMCWMQGYTLIMDEVTDVVDNYPLAERDFELLMDNFAYIDEDTGFIKWRDGHDDYNGKFADEKRLCDLNSLIYYGGSVMMWLFPVEVFNAFHKIFILTYMFPAQIQKYYYDFYKLPYKYLYVTGTDRDSFNFTSDETKRNIVKTDFANLISIIQEEKLNKIGEPTFALSMAWYSRNKHNTNPTILKNHMLNFFQHKCKTKTKENMWTTFKAYKPLLTGKGYGRGFVPLNTRATNDHAERVSLAYPINRYMSPNIKSFFVQHGVEINEDAYALSEMLQWIWRSAIRDNKPIKLYIPSKRMRDLLTKWIDDQDGIENDNTDL